MNVLSGASNSGRNAGASGSRSFGVRYPSPFFDIAQQFLPDNVLRDSILLYKWDGHV